MADIQACTDHGCIYGHPGGMGTNGGCKCLYELPLDKRRRAEQNIRALRAQLTARDAEVERLNENIKTLLANHQTVRAKLEAAERDASQLREAASAMLDKIDYNINNERLPLTYTVPWEQAVALRRAVRKDAAIYSARGGERG